jgi:MFS family permease
VRPADEQPPDERRTRAPEPLDASDTGEILTVRVEEGPPGRQRRRIAGLPRNVFWLGMVSLFNDIGSEMIFPVLPIFLRLGLGASMAAVGLIDGIAESSAGLVKIFSGAISDRFRRRRPLVVAGYALSNIAQPLIGLATSWQAVLPLRFFDRVGKGVRTPPRDAIIGDTVDAGTRGWAFGFHRAMDSAGGVLGPIITFAILAGLAAGRGEPVAQLFSAAAAKISDYRWVILAAAVPNAVAIGLIFLVHERTRVTAVVRRIQLGLPEGPFRVMLAATTIFSLGNMSYSFLVLRSSDLGIPVVALPLVYLFFHLAQMLLSGPLGALSDRIGRRPVIGAGYVAFGVMCLGWMLARSPWHAIVLSALYGFSLACTEGAVRAYTVDLVPAERRGAALGALNGAMGLAALPASAVAGVLWTAVGPAAAFAWGAAFSLAGAVALALVRAPRSIR